MRVAKSRKLGHVGGLSASALASCIFLIGYGVVVCARTSQTRAEATPTSATLPSYPSTTSPNWSGYVLQYPPDQPVSGTITVPQVDCNTSGRVSMWVGYDGWETDSDTVEQDGVSAICSAAGAAPHFVTWFELFKVPTNYSGYRQALP